MATDTAVDRLVARLTHQPEGRRSLVGLLVRYGITGGLAVSVDSGLLALLHSGVGVPLLWSTLIAFAVGVAINYSLNRNWVFQSELDHRVTLIRYAVVVGLNVIATLLIVLGLTHLGVYYLISKGIAVVLIAIGNFTAGRHWIFPT